MTQTEKSVIRRVLLVDDDEAVRAMMSATLESKGAGGTDVQVAAQLPKSFSHASDSDTGSVDRSHLRLLFRRYALTSILDFHANLTVRSSNANTRRWAF